MRSPNSSVGSLFPETSESDRAQLDQQRRLRVAALRSVPTSLARDIIQHEPKDSYQNIQIERDRRLRLTIRRYVNQIQHGCHNRNCTTATCLSYRRRHSKTPVRQYTDTSARALACHLVDEASRNRQDPALGFCPNQPVVPWYQDPRTTQQRRDRLSATPSRPSRQQSLVDSRNTQEKRLSTTSHPVNATSGHSRRSSGDAKSKNTMHLENQDADGRSPSQATRRRPSGDASVPLIVRGTEPTLRTEDPVKAAADGTQTGIRQPARANEEIIAHREVDGNIRYLVVWREGAAAKMAWSSESTIQDKNVLVSYKKEHGPSDALDGDQLANLEAALEEMPISMIEDQLDARPNVHKEQHEDFDKKPQRIDFASFTQTLWNTLTLRNIESREQVKKGSHTRIAEVDMSEIEREDEFTTLETEESKISMLSNTAFRGFTLRRLSWDNLEFLMDSTKDRQSARGSPFETFIKQSVYHSVANPNRLLAAADQWHWEEADDSEDDVESVASEDSKCPQHAKRWTSGATDHDQAHMESDRRLQMYGAETTMTAFQSIESILGNTDVLFDALYNTLQQCYEVDFPTYGGPKEAKVARKAFKGVGGGLYNLSGKASAPTKNLLQQTGTLPTRAQVSRIFFLTLIALATPLFSYRWSKMGLDSIGLITIADLRGDNEAGFASHGRDHATQKERRTLRLLTEVLDHLDDWQRCRLAAALTDCISHHVAAGEIRRIKSHSRTKPRTIIHETFSMLQRDFEEHRGGDRNDPKFRLTLALGIVDVARTVLIRNWDRQPTIARTGPVGGALELLSAMFHNFDAFELGERAHLFQMPFIAAAFDEMELPNDWLDFQSNSQRYHILDYPFLFETVTLVKYFRAINITAMKAQYEIASMVYTDAFTYLQSSHIPVYGGRDIDQIMRPYMAKYLVLTVRRTHLLEDAMDQLWRRQRREILRPLRVRLGQSEGEDGIDYGGVQQEFFRLAFAEAFNPAYGMFTVDDRTKMTWFQPGSQEPLWRFEAIGLLMGIAVYNGVNLPINLPIAFYRKLLGFDVRKLEHIKDGWPDLEKGLRQLLEYDGDVAEDIGRTYEFSYEFGGEIYTKDISGGVRSMRTASPALATQSRKGKEKAKSPTFDLPTAVSPPPELPLSASASPDIDTSTSDASSPIEAIDSNISISTPLSTPSPSLGPTSPVPHIGSDEPPLVTNDTRERYIKDYIVHLTDVSVASQYFAFARGVHAALHPRALHLFTPTQLRDLIEGERHIDIDDLEQHATYEEFDEKDPYIRGFWEVIREEATKDDAWAGQLLEFVLASARVPVGGWGGADGQGRGSIVVQKNGDEWIDPAALNASPAQVDEPADESNAASEAAAAPATATPVVTVSTDDDNATGSPGAVVAAVADDVSEASAEAQTTGEHLTEQPRSPYRARLPSSSTCYARLLLPRYHISGEDETGSDGNEPGRQWKEVLRERLKKAIAEGRGFGML